MNHDERTIQCHGMLLRLAGSAPDDLMSQCRDWLAAGRLSDVARAITHAALAWRVPVPEPDYALLADLLAAAGADPSVLAFVQAGDPVRTPVHAFATTRVMAHAVLQGLSRPDEAVGDPDSEEKPEDAVCADAITAVAAETSTRALWRAWRFPVDHSPWPSPRRVFTVETDEGADIVGLTARLQSRLHAAGETSPQVEVYVTGAELPPYQRYARASAALLWARTPQREFRVAPIPPALDPANGLPLDPGTPRVDDVEREPLLAYLRQGEAVLVTDEHMVDVFDPTGAELVPLDILTDGHWLWTGAAAYYLDRHHLQPEPELVAHIRERGYRPPRVDGAAVHRALRALNDLD